MSERYRVAIVTRTFPPKSGGVATTQYHLLNLLARDHDVKAFAFDDGDETPSLNVVRRKSHPLPASLLRWAFTRYVRRYDKSHPPIYCQGLAAVIPAARGLSRPLRAFRPDVVIVPDNYVPGLALSIPPGASVIWVSHHNFKRFEGQPLVHQRSWMDIHLAHRMELRALRKADLVVCPSYYMKRVFEETYPIERPIEVIYNFIEASTLANVKPSNLRERLGIDEDCRLIYLPSAGTPVKGKRFASEIIRRLGARGRTAFYISGPIGADLARELESLDDAIPVFAPGHVPYQENLGHVAACDFAVSPTLIENLSNAIVEGLMLGLPFVTFDTGGNKEIVHSGVNGFVVPYLDVEALIARAAELLDDEVLLHRLRDDTRKPLEHLLDEERIRKQYQQVFDRLRGSAPAADDEVEQQQGRDQSVMGVS